MPPPPLTPAGDTGTPLRQQLLFLWCSHPSPASETVAWSVFDGASSHDRTTGDADEPPYPSVIAAMRDGWRVLQVAQQHPPGAGLEHRTSYLPYEFILERLVPLATPRVAELTHA